MKIITSILLVLCIASPCFARPLSAEEEKEFEARYRIERQIERGELPKSIDINLLLLLNAITNQQFEYEQREYERQQRLQEAQWEMERRHDEAMRKLEDMQQSIQRMRREDY